MNVSNFFEELGMGDPDMEQARTWVSYKQFEKSIPEILSLDEYVNTIFKNSVMNHTKPQLWFSEKYMISRYIETTEIAEQEYIDKVIEKFNLLSKRIPNEVEYQHIHLFISILKKYLTEKRTILPKQVLMYLNDLYSKKEKH